MPKTGTSQATTAPAVRAGPTEYAMTVLAIVAGLMSCAVHAGIIPIKPTPSAPIELPSDLVGELAPNAPTEHRQVCAA